MSDYYWVTCDCGHKGSATYREKDNPYSSVAIWRFFDVSCMHNIVENPYVMSIDQAIKTAKPNCPACGCAITESMFERTRKSDSSIGSPPVRIGPISKA
jgi:hypothetical protein